MHNGMIKVITRVKGRGKSYLLFNIFYDYLIKSGINKSHIIKIQLDNILNEELLEIILKNGKMKKAFSF